MMDLVTINDHENINPAFVVFTRKVQGDRLEIHMHGGTVLYSDNVDILNPEPEKPIKKGK